MAGDALARVRGYDFTEICSNSWLHSATRYSVFHNNYMETCVHSNKFSKHKSSSLLPMYKGEKYTEGQGWARLLKSRMDV